MSTDVDLEIRPELRALLPTRNRADLARAPEPDVHGRELLTKKVDPETPSPDHEVGRAG
jgi:hypothetical protein